MNEIKPTPAELSEGKLDEPNLHAALSALKDDGFVVLRDIVAPAHIETLRDKMLSDVDEILKRSDAPFNFNTGNLQQDPPPFAPYLFRDVLLNDLVIQVSKALLGPGVKNSYYSGNTALPGGSRQPVHPDVAQLWPSLQHATPPFGLVINIPVVDATPQNGGTELWPGTHRNTTFSIHQGSARISEEILETRRGIHPPIQPSIKAGSVLLRDIRLWHAGMPNYTEIPRPMIAMIHWCSWWLACDPIPFPQSEKEFFAHPDLTTNARWMEDKPEYLKHNQSYDLQPTAGNIEGEQDGK